MKIFKNWGFVFLVAILLVFSMLFFNLLKDEMKTAAKDWSKEIAVSVIDNTLIDDFAWVRVTTVPIPKENRFITLWNEKASIVYVSIDGQGKRSQLKRIPMVLDSPRDIKAVLNNNKINLYVLTSGKLNKYDFDYEAGKISLVNKLSEDVNSFVMEGKSLFLCSDKFIKFVDGEGGGAIRVIDTKGCEVIGSHRDEKGIYKLAFIKTDKGEIRHLMYGKFNSSKVELKVHEFGQFIGTANDKENINNIIISSIKNKISIIIPRKNYFGDFTCTRPPKTANTQTILYSFEEENPEKVSFKYISEINGYNPNPVKIPDKSDEINILASILSVKGNKTDMINLKQYGLVDGKIIDKGYLTNTVDISTNPYWFTLGKLKYMQWEDISGTSKKIMYASTNGEVIKLAGKIKIGVIFNVFLSTIMAQGFSLAYMLLIFTCFVLPTLLIAIIVSMFFMNWVETHNKLAVNITVGIHILVEFIMTQYFKIKKPMSWNLMPVVFQNTLGMCIIILIIGLISYYCLKLKYKNKKLDNTFINQYAFFALINIILYSLLFFPYYYL